jgi:hypothetical protein
MILALYDCFRRGNRERKQSKRSRHADRIYSKSASALSRKQTLMRILTKDRSYFSAPTLALSTGCQVASGLYVTISLPIWSVLGPRSF